MDNPFKRLEQLIKGLDSQFNTLNRKIDKMSTKKEYLSRSEVAAKMNISLSTVDRLIKDQKIQKKKIGSKTLVTTESVNQYFLSLSN